MFIFKTYKPYFYINPKLFITIVFNETSLRSSMFPSDRHIFYLIYSAIAYGDHLYLKNIYFSNYTLEYVLSWNINS